VVSTFNLGRLGRSARDVLKAADALDDEIDAFLLAIQAIGEPCGDAESIGALLGPSIISAEDTTVMSLASVVEWLEVTAAEVLLMAANDAQTESDNADAVAAIGVR
jgi:hypothetical protein